mmetsp:Transcript_24656/g.60540  ORF Transcript_24656/g.60540 Transcript_24656/m.60540 type:complete len:98 (-) Transcript_24656:1987-2280(-)
MNILRAAAAAVKPMATIPMGAPAAAVPHDPEPAWTADTHPPALIPVPILIPTLPVLYQPRPTRNIYNQPLPPSHPPRHYPKTDNICLNGFITLLLLF